MSHFTFASVGVSWTQLVSIFTKKERSGSLANVLLDVDPFYLMEGGEKTPGQKAPKRRPKDAKMEPTAANREPKKQVS